MALFGIESADLPAVISAATGLLVAAGGIYQTIHNMHVSKSLQDAKAEMKIANAGIAENTSITADNAERVNGRLTELVDAKNETIAVVTEAKDKAEATLAAVQPVVELAKQALPPQ